MDGFPRIDHTIVLVCQSGGRAGQAHKGRAAAGKTTLHVLAGGISSWMAANGDLAQVRTWSVGARIR
jgi:rhodanese-related sulfurtransferase